MVFFLLRLLPPNNIQTLVLLTDLKLNLIFTHFFLANIIIYQKKKKASVQIGTQEQENCLLKEPKHFNLLWKTFTMSYLVQVPLHHCSCWLTSLLRHNQSTQGASQCQQTNQETTRTPGSGAEQFWKTPCSSGSETTSNTMLVQKQETSLFLPSFLIKIFVTKMVLPKYGYRTSLEPQTFYMDITLCSSASFCPAWPCPIQSTWLSASIFKACKTVN